MKKLFILLLLLFTVSCSSDDPGDVLFSSEIVKVTSARYSASNVDFDNTLSGFMAAVNEEDSLQVFLEVNHSANAIALGRVLNPTRTVFFGSPGMMVPLLMENQLAGLDLPQKMMFYQNENSEVFSVYNSIAYISSRYNLEQANHLQNSAVLLRNLANASTMAEVRTAADLLVAPGEGIITKESTLSIEETYNGIKSRISARDNLTILAEIDFQEYSPEENSKAFLRPTRLIIFGMPQLSTPLMRNSQTLALDLPQKILVWEDSGGVVQASYNDPSFLAERHELPSDSEEIQQITAILNQLVEAGP
ncbi:DUF302 domain-containing protein [Zunongwangia sp. H14]|uniref:DUF302 domain-containing protein n=1 Tax=Zunongwangia sp. H14 TaxID=3240792 RepID=UPI0035645C7E